MNVAEAIRKQAALAAKIAKGEASADERAEFERVNAALAAPPATSTVKTELATMTKAEFEAHMQAELGALEKAADAARLALLKSNIDAVRKQAEAGKTVFAVALPVIEKLDPMAAMLARLDELEKKFDSRFVTGVGEPKPGEPKAEPAAAAPAAEAAAAAAAPAEGEVAKKKESDDVDKAKESMIGAFATEMLDALTTRFAALKDKIAAGTATAEDVSQAFAGLWDVERMASTATQLSKSAAALTAVLDEIATAKAKGKKPFPGAAPPMGEGGKPEDDETKKAKTPATGDSKEMPASAPEGDMAEDEEECKGCGKKKAKGAACPTCDKAAKDDAPVVKGWGADMAASVTPKSSVDAYRMLKGAAKQ